MQPWWILGEGFNELLATLWLVGLLMVTATIPKNWALHKSPVLKVLAIKFNLFAFLGIQIMVVQ